MSVRLLKLKIYGIKNIQKEITLNFLNEYPSIKSVESDSFIKALYGPNGSGKTGVCLALYYYKRLNTDYRFLASDGAKNLIDIVNKKTKKFYIEVSFYLKYDDELRGSKYRHCLEITIENGRAVLTKEGLYTMGHRNELKPLYEYSSKNGIHNYTSNKWFDENVSDPLSSFSVRNFINHHGETDLSDTIQSHLFSPTLFSSSLCIAFGESKDTPNFYSRSVAALHLLEKKNADILIWDHSPVSFTYDEIVLKRDKEKYEERTKKLLTFVQKMKLDLKDIKTKYYKIDDNLLGVDLSFEYENYSVGYKFESSGVKKIVKLFDVLNLASKNSVIVIDEIDADIHDVFLSELIDYFVRYSDAQIFFTTHNVDLMTNIVSLKHSIDFLSQDNVLTPWIVNGDYSPIKKYLNGMISHIPFNLFSSDFIRIFKKD